jgi:hypothetical protein
VITLHPHEGGWLHGLSWQAHESGGGFGVSPKWHDPAPTRDAALKAAISTLAERIGAKVGVRPAANRAIMTWLEGLIPPMPAAAGQPGGHGDPKALVARAAAKGRLSRRKGAPGDDPAGKTQPEHQGEPA